MGVPKHKAVMVKVDKTDGSLDLAQLNALFDAGWAFLSADSADGSDLMVVVVKPEDAEPASLGG